LKEIKEDLTIPVYKWNVEQVPNWDTRIEKYTNE